MGGLCGPVGIPQHGAEDRKLLHFFEAAEFGFEAEEVDR